MWNSHYFQNPLLFINIRNSYLRPVSFYYKESNYLMENVALTCFKTFCTYTIFCNYMMFYLWKTHSSLEEQDIRNYLFNGDHDLDA